MERDSLARLSSQFRKSSQHFAHASVLSRCSRRLIRRKAQRSCLRRFHSQVDSLSRRHEEHVRSCRFSYAMRNRRISSSRHRSTCPWLGSSVECLSSKALAVSRVRCCWSGLRCSHGSLGLLLFTPRLRWTQWLRTSQSSARPLCVALLSRPYLGATAGAHQRVTLGEVEKTQTAVRS